MCEDGDDEIWRASRSWLGPSRRKIISFLARKLVTTLTFTLKTVRREKNLARLGMRWEKLLCWSLIDVEIVNVRCST